VDKPETQISMTNSKPKTLNSKQTQKTKLKTQNKYFEFFIFSFELILDLEF